MFRRSFAILAGAGQGPFDPYKILGVKPGASKDEVKRAYHRLALRFHPDGGPEGNSERFQAVHEAYQALKDGKWQPTAEQQKSGMSEGQGWDPKMRMYVYEQPGSTTENYVNSHTQTLLRLAMVWCFLFVMVRFLMLKVFPNTRPTPVFFTGAESTPTPAANTDAPVAQPVVQRDTKPLSVHDDDDAEAVWSLGSQPSSLYNGMSASVFGDDDKAGENNTMQDPLARRGRAF